MQLGKYEQALIYAQKALEIARQAGLRDDVRYAYEVLSGIYGALGQYRKAYEFHMEYGRMKDSLLDAQKEEREGDRDKVLDDSPRMVVEVGIDRP